MSGNTPEDRLLQEANNPSHTDPSRAGFLAGALAGFAVFAGLTEWVPMVGLVIRAIIGFAVTFGVGVVVTNMIAKKRAANAESTRQGHRDNRAAEAEKNLEKMQRGKDK